MAKVKQVYGEVRHVPWLGRDVQPDEVVDVPEEELAGYLEAGWEPADKATRAAQQKLWEDGKVTVGAPAPAPEPAPATDVKES